MVVCLLFGIFLSLFLAMPIFHKSIFEVFSAFGDIKNPGNIYLLKYFQVVQSIALFIIPPFLLAPLFGQKSSDYLKIKKTPAILLIIIASLLVLSAIPFINWVEEFNSKMKLPEFMKGIENWMKASEENAAQISESFLKVSSIGGLLFNLFMMAVLPALGEEFIFRGVFQRIFTDWFKNYHLGIIVAAIFFSAFHMQFYGFLPRMLLGIMFGYLLIWSGSMWVPIIAHFMNNSAGVIYYFFYYKGISTNNLDKIGSQNNGYIYALVSLVCVGLLLYLFYKYSKRGKCLN
jgi:membrane protease YdiL (CAAX protease family)